MGFEMKLLPLSAHIQADEMPQVLEGQLTFDLQLGGQWPAAIGTGCWRTFTTSSPEIGSGD